MDAVEKVITLFHSSIEAKAQFGEALAPQIVAASEKLASTLVHDGRIILCGDGSCAINAQHLTTVLLSQGQRERPGLPAQMLDTSAATTMAIGQDYGPGEIFSRQIQALGHESDLLVIFSTTGNPQSLVNAVQAAHDRAMQVISISGNDGGHVAQLLDRNDLEVRVPLSNDFQILELHLLISFVLCQLVEEQLFGSSE